MLQEEFRLTFITTIRNFLTVDSTVFYRKLLQTFHSIFLGALVETIITVLALNASSSEPIFLDFIGITVLNVILFAFIPRGQSNYRFAHEIKDIITFILLFIEEKLLNILFKSFQTFYAFIRVWGVFRAVFDNLAGF